MFGRDGNVWRLGSIVTDTGRWNQNIGYSFVLYIYRLLPWSTANEDLDELAIWDPWARLNLPIIFFFDGTRSKGACVDQVAEAETAVGTYYVPLQIVSFLSETVRGDVAKFRQYNAWGRPLSYVYPTVAKGGQAVPMQPDSM